MKKIVLFSILIFFLFVSAVSASENVTDDGLAGEIDDLKEFAVSENVTDDGLVGEIDDFKENSPLGNGSEDDSNSSDDNSSDDNSSDDGGDKPVSPNVVIKSKNLIAYYKIKPVYKVKIVDSKGHPIANKKVQFKLKGKTFSKKTNKNGFASLKIKLKPGKYHINIVCDKVSKKRTVKLFASRTFSRNIRSVYGKRVKYQVRVVNNYGRLKKTAVTFKVGKKVYHRHTNKKGIATLKLNLNSGKYVIRYSGKGFHGKNTYTVNNRITLKILKWGIKGNHYSIPLIRKNMPNSYWVKKAVLATKQGLPFLTFQGGNGKKVFITAGVHGNEIPPQVAVMKLIDYLSKKPIRGTVYMIPFVNIKAAEHRVRFIEYDFNRVANIKGTVSNSIVNLIVALKCDSYGDFHSTRSPGDPGLNIILGFNTPKKSVVLTNYLAKACNVYKKFHSIGGIHLWTLADWAEHRGIPSVICEVISKVSYVSPQNAALSYKMMDRFLRFHSII